jgi:hypothetical protein
MVFVILKNPHPLPPFPLLNSLILLLEPLEAPKVELPYLVSWIYQQWLELRTYLVLMT